MTEKSIDTSLELATAVANVALRGPVPLAKTLAALDVLSDGRVIAGVGPGSSERDYGAVGVLFEERWERFDEAVAILRSLLRDEPPPETRRHYALPGSPLAPAPSRPGGIPVWIGSWGSAAGLRRVARRRTARSCSRATRRQAASAYTSGHSATSRGRSSSQRRPCFQPSRRESGRPKTPALGQKQSPAPCVGSGVNRGSSRWLREAAARVSAVQVSCGGSPSSPRSPV